ncbi:TPA: restriction endonuclease subunit S [Streptococcus suis]|nr:restriction endonuclease subunit S [Streptococcus suis]
MTRMKDSGIEWIGEIPEEWGIVRLKDCLEINNGKDYKDIETDETGYPVIGSGGQFAYARKYLHDGTAILLGRKGTIDKPLYIEGKFWTVDTMFYGVSKSGIHAKFIYYVALQIPFGLYSTNTALPSMTQTDLQNHHFAMPPLDEQTQIADFLDKKVAQLDKVKSLLEEQIKTLEDYRQSLIYETVTKGLDKTVPLKDSGVDWIGQIPEGWEVKKHKYIMSKTKTLCSHYSGQKILSLTRQGVISRDVESGKGKMPASFDGYQFLTRGDLLLCLFDIDVTPRCVGVVESDGLTSPAYSRFKVSEDSSAYYYYYLFLSMDDDKVLLHLAKNLRNSLTEDDFGDIETIVPSYKEQVIIANYLNKKTLLIDKLIKLKKEQIENINKQRQTLIYDYVTGKRRV